MSMSAGVTAHAKERVVSNWRPIETMPKDGTIVQVREGEYAPTHAYWAGGRLRHVEYQHSNRPTQWRMTESSLRRDGRTTGEPT